MPECPNIYRTARESAGYTREKASEKIGYSVESLKVVESGLRVPPDSVAIRMVEVYNTPYLALQHLRVASEIGREVVPDVSHMRLAEAACAFWASIPDEKCIRRLMEMGASGGVPAENQEEFDHIIGKLMEMVKCVYSLQYYRQESD